MLPATDNITAYRGDTVREVRHFVIPDTDPVEYYDPTGCTPTAQVRTSTTADVLYTLACELIVGADEFDPSGVVMEIEAGVTDDAPAKAVWDYQLEFPDGSVRTFGKGTVKFSGQVTR
jgi:hypothetical protein